MDIVDYYASKFKTLRTNLNPKEIRVLNKLFQEYSFEDLTKAIDQLTSRPNPNNLINELLKSLNTKQRLTFNDIPDIYKRIFTQYNISTNLIDYNLLSSLDKYLKTVYLSDLIAEHLYHKLPKEKLSQYNKIANQHFSNMTLSEREKEEACKIYIKHLIKKKLGIYT
jgi:hypothetical protein